MIELRYVEIQVGWDPVTALPKYRTELQYRDVVQHELHFPNYIQPEISTPWKTVPTVSEAEQ